MRFHSIIILTGACVSQTLAVPVPNEPTAAELAAINATLHTQYGNLIAEKDACVAAATTAEAQEDCISDWHGKAHSVEEDRYFWNPKGSAEYELAKDRIDFHWIGIFPGSDGFFISN